MLARKLTILIIALLSMNACQQDACYTKEQFIQSYQAFFEEFENEDEKLDAKMTAAYEERYENLLESCYKKYKPDMTRHEREEFWKSSIKYYLKKEGGIFNINFNRYDEEDPTQEYIVSEIEELADSSAHELNLFMESVLEKELPRLIDSFVDKVSEWGEEVKTAIEEER